MNIKNKILGYGLPFLFFLGLEYLVAKPEYNIDKMVNPVGVSAKIDTARMTDLANQLVEELKGLPGRHKKIVKNFGPGIDLSAMMNSDNSLTIHYIKHKEYGEGNPREILVTEFPNQQGNYGSMDTWRDGWYTYDRKNGPLGMIGYGQEDIDFFRKTKTPEALIRDRFKVPGSFLQDYNKVLELALGINIERNIK